MECASDHDEISLAIKVANITATLGSFYWLGFETSGHSPDKKRLALLGAQRLSDGRRVVEVN